MRRPRSSTWSTTTSRSTSVNVALTTKEFEVLAFLARHAGKTCTHQMILGAVWGTGYGAEAQYVHAYVHRLRQKVERRVGRTHHDGAGRRLLPQLRATERTR